MRRRGVYRPAIATDHVLAIDLGTGGPKAALVDAEGRTVAWSSVAVATTLLPAAAPSRTRRRCGRRWSRPCRTTLAACRPPPRDRRCGRDQPVHERRARCAGTAPRPGRASCGWTSAGAANNLALLTDESFALFLDRHGLIPLPSGNDNVAHIAVLRDLHPAAYAAADAFVEPMDYVNARLTGRVCATQSTAFSTLCCDNRTWGAVDVRPRARRRHPARPGEARAAGPDGRVRRRGDAGGRSAARHRRRHPR